MTIAANLGFPRLGADRELKRALEGYWARRVAREDLLAVAADLRARHWRLQAGAGVERVPSNDFSLYDQVLDATAMLGAVPERFGWSGDVVDLETYFAMARGTQDAAACEMTKWFDTNYHYIVPELHADLAPRLASTKAVDEYVEARALGIPTRPVLIGPVSWLLLAKAAPGASFTADDRWSLLDAVTAVYEQVLGELAAAGAQWVQIDEPCLVVDLDDGARDAYRRAYERLAAVDGTRLLLTTYFAGLGPNRDLALDLPVAGLHIDLVRDPDQLEPVLAQARDDLVLSLGVIDGRNVWRADLDRVLDRIEPAVPALGAERVEVAPSCSLLHTPVDVQREDALDPEIRLWLAFATQKLDEVATVAKALNEGRGVVADELAASRDVARRRAGSARTREASVRDRLAAVDDAMTRRNSPYNARREAQADRIGLPPLPTTTIGSYPQTAEVRRARAAFRRGDMSAADYERFLREQAAAAIRQQEQLGLDVLVHGELERTDMVEYFGEQLAGFSFTRHGWVQSYGSRGVKPPIVYGDVSRPAPMTVDWWRYSQSLTERPVKGMLTGPVTILQWSFVRDDQPRAETARQIALAIRDEVADLESAGAQIIQIDEPALREGLPLRRADWNAYLQWATAAFRLASAGVDDATQIHTHMCYSEFGDIIDAIVALDADVLSIESSRSNMELLDDFRGVGYPNEIGPGVYDIHSPRVPDRTEIAGLLEAALGVLSVDQLWVNPDCGLKTRTWDEVLPSLANMVDAAREVRERLHVSTGGSGVG